MSASILALTGYLLWMMVLLVFLESYRTVLVLKEKRAANSFNPDGSDMSAFGHRLTRAFGNTLESFAFIGGTLLLALATGSSVITDGLAYIVLAARIAQSVTHLMSGSAVAVQIRFVFFLVQQVIVIYWLYMLLMKFVG